MSSIPSKALTWTHRHTTVNTSVAATDWRTVAYEIKAALVAAGGVVQSSSNGTSYGEADYWASYEDITTNNSNSTGWCVVRFTNVAGSIFEVLLQFNYDRYNSYTKSNAYYSTTGYSGGNATTIPTATKSNTIFYTGGISHKIAPNNTSKKIVHSMWSASGAFRLFVSYNSLTVFAFGFEKTSSSSNAVPADEDYCVWRKYTDAATTQVSFTANNALTTECSRYSAGLGATLAYGWTGEVYNGTLLTELLSSPNPLDVDGSANAQWPVMPIGLVSTTSAAHGYGRDARLIDAYWVRSGHAVGATYPATGKAWIHVGGGLLVPNDGTNWVIA